jgi:predicted ATPase
VDGRLIELAVDNFRSLRELYLPLNPLNVLVGPNGAGKTNVLEVFRFLADVIRADLEPALDDRGGFDEVAFWGGAATPDSIRISLKALWTEHSSVGSPDEYLLIIDRRNAGRGSSSLARKEMFHFNRPGGGSRRININGDRVEVTELSGAQLLSARTRIVGIKPMSSGLSTLRRLSEEMVGSEVGAVAERLASIRLFDVDVDAARRPSRFPPGAGDRVALEHDAANLASFLLTLSHRDETSWVRLVQDAAEVLPRLQDIGFDYPSGAAREVVVSLQEEGLRRQTPLADASYGTIRLLGLLALLYDADPPALTCVEEIDHGLHPQALELLVERLREASKRTQFLVATHSPTFADRLRPAELIVCERRADGSSVIPAVSVEQINNIVAASEGLPLGELWFSGSLGGDL